MTAKEILTTTAMTLRTKFITSAKTRSLEAKSCISPAYPGTKKRHFMKIFYLEVTSFCHVFPRENLFLLKVIPHFLWVKLITNCFQPRSTCFSSTITSFTKPNNNVPPPFSLPYLFETSNHLQR